MDVNAITLCNNLTEDVKMALNALNQKPSEMPSVCSSSGNVRQCNAATMLELKSQIQAKTNESEALDCTIKMRMLEKDLLQYKLDVCSQNLTKINENCKQNEEQECTMETICEMPGNEACEASCGC